MTPSFKQKVAEAAERMAKQSCAHMPREDQDMCVEAFMKRDGLFDGALMGARLVLEELQSVRRAIERIQHGGVGYGILYNAGENFDKLAKEIGDV